MYTYSATDSVTDNDYTGSKLAIWFKSPLGWDFFCVQVILLEMTVTPPLL